jgi:hypothetical protein
MAHHSAIERNAVAAAVVSFVAIARVALAQGVDSAAPPVAEPRAPTANASALIVDREPGAEACPDQAALTASVVAIRGEAELGDARYDVRFATSADGYKVTIRSDPSGLVRTIESSDATCSALARATAVTLAVLFDSEPEDRATTPVPAPPPAPSPGSRRPSPRESVSPTFTPSGALPATTELSLGATALAGVLGPVAFGASGDLGLEVKRFRAGVGVLWMPTRSLALGPGDIRESLTAGRLALCYAPLATARFRLDACSGAMLGVMTAAGRGFSRDERRVRPWLAVPVVAEAAIWTGRIGWGLEVGAVFPAHRSDFSIDGLGAAYRSPSVAGIAALCVTLLGPSL